MSDEATDNLKPAHQGKSPRSGTAPPAATRWKPGQSGNPAGNPNFGKATLSYVNRLGSKCMTRAALEALARNNKRPIAERVAAMRLFRVLEVSDLADFHSLIDGTESVTDLKARGIDTSVIKRFKRRTRTSGDVVTIETEIELHDRSGEEFDRTQNYSNGRPVQADMTQRFEELEAKVNAYLAERNNHARL